MLRFSSTATRSAFMPNCSSKAGERERRVEIARFAIDLQLHLPGFSQLENVDLLDRQASARDLGFDFAQLEFAGCGAAGVVGLHQHGGIRQ